MMDTARLTLRVKRFHISGFAAAATGGAACAADACKAGTPDRLEVDASGAPAGPGGPIRPRIRRGQVLYFRGPHVHGGRATPFSIGAVCVTGLDMQEPKSPGERLARVNERIAQACARSGRDPSTVSLVAVSKTHPGEAVAALAQAGQELFGESYVQEALPKMDSLAGMRLRWHFIGRLQKNKAKYAVRLFALIHSVDSFSLAEELKGNGCRLIVLTSGPRSALARSADLVIVNGMGMEGWMERLIKTSGYMGPVVVATKGITPRGMTAEEKEEHGHGAKHERKIDPHAWQNLANGQVYVDNIAAGLSLVDPAGAPIYKANAEAYMAKLSELDKWVKSEFSSIPKPQRRLITSHDAFGYLGAAYGITILSPMGVSTESEPSAGGVARLIKQIRKEKISAVFIENVSDPRLVEQISKESGVKLGGELYSDALSKPEGPAPTYIDMFKNNVTKMVAAMRKGL